MLPIIINIDNPIIFLKNHIFILFLILLGLAVVIFTAYIIYLKIKKLPFSKKHITDLFAYSITPSIILFILYLILSNVAKDDTINISNYEGIYFFIGILSSLIYMTYLAKKENIDVDIMYEAGFFSVIAAILIGRLFPFLFWDKSLEILKNPAIFFNVTRGGISVTGGVIAGVLTGFLYAKIKKINFFYHIQLFVPAILLGQIIGRFGCFLNGDSGGMPTNMPWGVVFHPMSIAYENIMSGTPLHPTQLYEIFGNIILLLFILLTAENEWIKRRSIIWYAIGYGIIRFIVEFFRVDANRVLFNTISTGQLIALSGIILGAALLIWSLFNDEKLIADEKNIARPPKDKKKK